MNDTVLLYEELSLNALPALQTQFYDGWVLRYTNGYGYTNRANSVNILYPSKIDMGTKVTECEKRYFAQGLPAVFKITDSLDGNLDSFLEGKRYDVVTPTYLMSAGMDGIQSDINGCVLTDCIDNEWLNAYFRLSEYVDSKKISIAKQVFSNIRVTVICGRLIKDGETIACGLCAVERGFAGLFNVVVDEAYRGRGYGKGICVSLLSAAKRVGVHTTYLQAVQENNRAVNLYTKLGYMCAYSYWYRVKRG